ncbi:hypothetical protein E2C01_056606 [Portunus trituberculatus]|uniref:Uncharacterized protein n=1 Tax=Portunus trituberculatus TaxID=210409 RepID=A0A5B7GQT4_PORTR|nr:hypothetical protein [Portunus trituberculatus]
MHLGGWCLYNERQRGTDPNLTQNARAPKHSTAPPRPSGSPAYYSSQFKNFAGLQVLPDERIPD